MMNAKITPQIQANNFFTLLGEIIIINPAPGSR